MTRRVPKTIMYVLLICLSIRFLLFLVVKPWNPIISNKIILQSDAIGYNNLALNIIDHLEFSYEKNGKPDDLRTPLYPLFIGILYYLFDSSPWIVLLIQIFIDTFSCFLIYLIILKSINTKIALYSALFYALDPFLIFYTVNLFSEIIFIFFCILGYYSFTKAILVRFEKTSIKYICFSGLFFGLATLVRPILFYFPFIILIFFIVNFKYQLKKTIIFFAIFISGFLFIISPWLIRNYDTFGSLSLSTSGAINLLILYVSPMEMERRNEARDTVEKSLLKETDSLIIQSGLNPKNLNNFQKSYYCQKLALFYFKRYPISFLKHYIHGIFDSFTNLATSDYAFLLQLPNIKGKFVMKAYSNTLDLIIEFFTQKTIYEIIIGVFIIIFLMISYLGLILGLFLSWKDGNRIFLLFSLLVAIYFILITGTAGLARYRLPAVPFYMSFVGIGFNAFQLFFLGKSKKVLRIFKKGPCNLS